MPLPSLPKRTVPEEVNEAYGARNIAFGKDQIIPKPLDPRLITFVAPAVAKAAIESGVARVEIEDWDGYVQELNRRLGLENKLLSNISQRARQNPKRLIFAEADNYKILKAAQIAREEGIAEPLLLGNATKIRKLIEENGLELENIKIIDPKSRAQRNKRKEYAQVLFEKRHRKGLTFFEADKLMRERKLLWLYDGGPGRCRCLCERNYPELCRCYKAGLTNNWKA